MVGTRTTSDVVLVVEAIGVCFFTISVSRVSFCDNSFYSFLSVGFLFFCPLFVFCSKTDCCGLCGSLVFSCFKWFLENFEARLKRTSSFNLGLFWFMYREIFSYIQLYWWH